VIHSVTHTHEATSAHYQRFLFRIDSTKEMFICQCCSKIQAGSAIANIHVAAEVRKAKFYNVVAICHARNVTIWGYVTKRPEMTQIIMLLPETKRMNKKIIML
jgi:hypothetical protein